MNTNKIKLHFFDFDGTFCNSPLPDTGKLLWAEYHGKTYPHIGWWGREESLDMNVFNITLRDEIYNEYLKSINNSNIHNYILTSRQPKLKSNISKILDNNNVKMLDIICAYGNLTKGDQIIKLLNNYEINDINICEINFWDDRNKEIMTVEAIRPILESKNIILNTYKVISDATD